MGAHPTDVKALGVHMLSADSHKWMLGIIGIGAVFVDRRVQDHIHPPLIGWRSTSDAFNFDRVHLELAPSALRYEEGSLAYPLVAGLSAALELLEDVGMDRAQARIEPLVASLARGLEDRGAEIGPAPESRSHILTFRHPGLEEEGLMDALRCPIGGGLPSDAVESDSPLTSTTRKRTWPGCSRR